MSRREQVIATLHKELPRLQRDYGVSALSLFGSMARGDDAAGSDVDLLVEFDRPTGLIAQIGLQLELSELLGCKVDLGSPDALRPHLRDRVLAESVRVA